MLQLLDGRGNATATWELPFAYGAVVGLVASQVAAPGPGSRRGLEGRPVPAEEEACFVALERRILLLGPRGTLQVVAEVPGRGQCYTGICADGAATRPGIWAARTLESSPMTVAVQSFDVVGEPAQAVSLHGTTQKHLAHSHTHSVVAK